jgi:hypothetical protein
MKRSVLVWLVWMLWSSAAHAQPAGAQAEVLFRQGRELMAAGKIGEACTAFAASQQLDPAVTTLINLAGCREQNGQLATAWGLFLDAERQTRGAIDRGTKQLHDVAAARAKKLEPRISKLTINVPQQSQLDGLEIARDSERVDSPLWNRALPIDGGTYTITARAPGTNEWSTKVTVGVEADTKTVDIPDLRSLPRDLRSAPAGAVAEPSPDEDEDDDTPPPHARSQRVPLLVGAGGLALLGGALGLELWARSTYDDAKAEMTSQTRRDSLYDSANTKRYVGQGLAVAGAAAVGIAVWLYLRGSREPTMESASKLVVSPTGVAWTGAF